MSIAVHDIHEKVAKFIREEFARKENRMCVRLEFLHTPPNSRTESVKTWAREDAADTDYFTNLEYVERLSSDIVDMAEERADLYRLGMGAENIFRLRTRQHSGGGSSYTFKIQSASDGGDVGMQGDLPASASGVLALQMRAQEQAMRVNKDMMAGTISALLRQLGDALDENKQLRAERADLVREINANKGAEAERELAVVRQAHAEQRKDMFANKVVQFLPTVGSHLIEKVTGKAPVSTMLPQIIADLGASLASNPQQMAALGAILSESQRAQLGEAMRLAQAAKVSAPGTPGSINGSKPDGASAQPNGVSNSASAE